MALQAHPARGLLVQAPLGCSHGGVRAVYQEDCSVGLAVPSDAVLEVERCDTDILTCLTAHTHSPAQDNPETSCLVRRELWGNLSPES